MTLALTNSPISFYYPRPILADIGILQAKSQEVSCCRSGRIKAINTYWAAGLRGTRQEMTARDGVVAALEGALINLPDEFELWIFDAFRTKATQLALFESMYAEKGRQFPELADAELYAMTREFVAHPEEVSRFVVPPHNSGGALDLVISRHGMALDMGTEFDSALPQSMTAWFEQDFDPSQGIAKGRWLEIRANRRLLFNLMKNAGFVNYEPEWWHYDLGDCIWAAEHGVDWFYPSMED